MLAAPNNNSQTLPRNEYRLPVAPSSLIQRQLPSNEVNGLEPVNFTSREPPPSYWASYRNLTSQVPQPPPRRRPAPAPPSQSQINQIAIRSRVEEYRNRISVSDSESEEDRVRRSRILSPRRNTRSFKNEVLLGKDSLSLLNLILK